MSQFYSDLFTLTTATCVGAAMLVGHFDWSEPETEAVQPTTVGALVAQAQVVEVTDTTPRTTPRVVQFDTVPQATLLQVSFTSTEDDLFPRASSARASEQGIVTGNTVNLRTGPGTGFAVAGRAVLDQRLDVTGARDGIWIEVFADGLDDPVWIHGKFFRTP